MAEFYSARSWEIPPLPWTNLSPPFSDMGAIILIAAGLGFLGLGAQPPSPEWGLMVSDGRNYLVDQWWVSTLPGTAILIVVLGFNLVGDGFRDILDPHQRQS